MRKRLVLVIYCIVFVMVPAGNAEPNNPLDTTAIADFDTAQLTVKKCPQCGRTLSRSQPVCPVCVVQYISKEEAVLQRTERFPISLSFSVGMNAASMYGSEIDALKLQYFKGPYAKLGTHFGVVLSYSLNKSRIWFLQGEWSYSQKGFKADLSTSSLGEIPYGISDVSMYVIAKRNFFEFPLVLKAKLCPDKTVKPYFLLGPILSFVRLAKDQGYLTYKAVTNYNGDTEKKKENLGTIDYFKDTVYVDSTGNQLHYSFNDFYRRYDIGALSGAGLEFIVSKNVGLLFDARYVLGLMNFNHLSAKARKEIAAMNKSGSSQVVILGDPVAKYGTWTFSSGLEFFF